MAMPDDLRKRLLAAPRIGPRVVERLEQAGFDSAAKMMAAGVAQMVAAVCATGGSPAWRNRQSALQAALTSMETDRPV